jgi:hypothetical protein
MCIVSPASKDGRSIADLSRKRDKDSQLVRQRQNAALRLRLTSKNAEVASTSATARSKAKKLRHRSVAGCMRQRHTDGLIFASS